MFAAFWCPSRASTGSAGVVARAAPRPPLPPRARRSPGAAIAFDCRRHQVDGPRVAFGRRRCQGGVAVAASMPAHQQMASAMRRGRPLAPPRARRSPGVAITFGRRCSDEKWHSGVDGRTSTGPSPPPPQRARHSPGLPPPRSLSPWRRDRVRLSPSRRRSGRWSMGGCVFSYILSIVYPPPPAFFCPDLSPRKQTSLSLRLR